MASKKKKAKRARAPKKSNPRKVRAARKPRKAARRRANPQKARGPIVVVANPIGSRSTEHMASKKRRARKSKRTSTAKKNPARRRRHRAHASKANPKRRRHHRRNPSSPLLAGLGGAIGGAVLSPFADKGLSYLPDSIPWWAKSLIKAAVAGGTIVALKKHPILAVGLAGGFIGRDVSFATAVASNQVLPPGTISSTQKAAQMQAVYQAQMNGVYDMNAVYDMNGVYDMNAVYAAQ